MRDRCLKHLGCDSKSASMKPHTHTQCFKFLPLLLHPFPYAALLQFRSPLAMVLFCFVFFPGGFGRLQEEVRKVLFAELRIPSTINKCTHQSIIAPGYLHTSNLMILILKVAWRQVVNISFLNHVNVQVQKPH